MYTATRGNRRFVEGPFYSLCGNYRYTNLMFPLLCRRAGAIAPQLYFYSLLCMQTHLIFCTKLLGLQCSPYHQQSIRTGKGSWIH